MQAFSKEVEKMEKYQIQFSGLKPGTHSFDFNLDQTFFEYYQLNEITGSKVRVHIDMEKEERMLVLRFDISGSVNLSCDRCGDPLTMNLKGQQSLVVKLSDHNEEESEDVQIVKESESRFDLSQFIYEYVSLMLPAYRVHGNNSKGESLCNPDILKKLEELKESHAPDPRWEVLNKLREKK
ncbi:MAG: DUF177 domain-containing protein [Bacteroidetes bacterium]|nr:DUF177 domain-containing protein [Bacteroidota bacterium]